MTSSIGELFKVSVWGESHGTAIGAMIDGCPAGVKISTKDLQYQLDRRRPGNSRISSARDENDEVEVLSGIYKGISLGSPISLMIKNMDARPEDYASIQGKYRPGHAEFTYQMKYGVRDPRGGGRASARVTAPIVAAGTIARIVFGKEIIAYVKQVKETVAPINPLKIKAADVESSMIRCPDANASKKMISVIEEAKKKGDSVGGVIECIIRDPGLGLGEPIFDKLDADLAKAMLSINAAKGFEIGSGFGAAEKYGSENNDEFISIGKEIRTKTNNSGGILGGISNGMPIIFRVAFKPVSTISIEQTTVDVNGKTTTIIGEGRHDTCVLARAVPIVEAMAAIVLCDHYLRNKTSKVN